MSDDQFDSFEEFWPHYLSEHSDPTNRLLHALGTTAAVATAITGLVKKKPKLLALAPLLGYGPAWIGHYLIEGNRPATLDHPVWSLRGDFRMLRLILNDEIEEEMLRMIAEGKTTPQLLEELAAAE